MATFKPAYLIQGDDHGRIAERRAALRKLAEGESGTNGVEVFEGDTAVPDAVAGALSAMTLAIGRRFVIVDGVERWKDGDLDALEAALAGIDPETTVAFFGRDEGRTKTPARLAAAVTAAGGAVAVEATVKPWELPKWAIARAKELGLTLDSAGAKALVAQVGDRQQRLMRELEKLALLCGPDAQIGADEVEQLTARSSERKAWSLADALVARDLPAAARMFVELRAQGERVEGLLYQMTLRLRAALGAATRLEAGESPAQVKRSLRMPAKAAERLLADVARTDRDALRRALDALATLELESRGGGTALDKDTVAVRTLVDVTG